MKLFLDSANIAEIRELQRWRVIDGVTTTPTFFSRLGIDDATAAVGRLATEIAGELHVEALGDDAEQIIVAAHRNREIGANVVSKIPISPAGLEAASRLCEQGIAVNLHLVFSVGQALLAAKTGAAYVCPLMGRLNDAGLDAVGTVTEICRALSLHPELSTMVMVSSIRSPDDARRALLTGASAITIPGRVLRQMVQNPLTELAVGILSTDMVENAPVSRHMRGLLELPVVRPSMVVSDALVAMTLKGIGIAAVVDSNDHLLGVATDGDVRRALTRSLDSRSAAVESVMTRDPKTVSPDERVARAIELMRVHRIAQVLVLGSRNELAGFLCLHDLMGSPPLRPAQRPETEA